MEVNKKSVFYARDETLFPISPGRPNFPLPLSFRRGGMIKPGDKNTRLVYFPETGREGGKCRKRLTIPSIRLQSAK